MRLGPFGGRARQPLNRARARSGEPLQGKGCAILLFQDSLPRMFFADVEGFIMKELKQHHEGAWNRQTSWCRGSGSTALPGPFQAPGADPGALLDVGSYVLPGPGHSTGPCHQCGRGGEEAGFGLGYHAEQGG